MTLKVRTRRFTTSHISSGQTIVLPSGNLLGALTLRLPDALMGTTQTSRIEVTCRVIVDGAPIDHCTLEAEWFVVETG